VWNGITSLCVSAGPEFINIVLMDKIVRRLGMSPQRSEVIEQAMGAGLTRRPVIACEPIELFRNSPV